MKSSCNSARLPSNPERQPARSNRAHCKCDRSISPRARTTITRLVVPVDADRRARHGGTATAPRTTGSATMQRDAPRKLTGIEAGRGVAASLVLLYHVARYADRGRPAPVARHSEARLRHLAIRLPQAPAIAHRGVDATISCSFTRGSPTGRQGRAVCPATSSLSNVRFGGQPPLRGGRTGPASGEYRSNASARPYRTASGMDGDADNGGEGRSELEDRSPC